MGERSGEKCLGVERSKQTNLTKFFEFEFCKAQHGGFQILEKLAIKKCHCVLAKSSLTKPTASKTTSLLLVGFGNNYAAEKQGNREA